MRDPKEKVKDLGEMLTRQWDKGNRRFRLLS